MKMLRASFKGQRRGLVLLTVLSALGAVFEAAALITLVPLATAVASRERYEGSIIGVEVALPIAGLFALAIGFILARTISLVVCAYVKARIVANYEASARQRLFEAFLDARWDKQAQERGGQLQDLVTTFVANGMNALDALCASLVSLFSLAMMMVASILVNAVAALTIIVAVGVTWLAVRPVSLFTRRFSIDQTRLNQEYSHAVNQVVSLVREVRIFNAGPVIKDRMQDLVRRSQRNKRMQLWLYTTSNTLYQNIALLLVIGGLAGVYIFRVGRIESLAAIVLLLLRALSYSQLFQSLYHRFLEVSPYATTLDARLEELLAEQDDIGGVELERIDEIRFSKVSFSYLDDKQVLRDVDFVARRGEIIGVIGPSGAGKSTFVQLLLGLRAPASGQVLVNGVALDEISQPSWFNRVGFVPQEVMVLNATVAENIAFYRTWIPEDEVVHAARLANIHEEVLSWTDGYQTVVGERGSMISGGQRQRLCIARALVGNPDLLVFDEPTSALDMESERLIQQTLEERGKSMIVFIVAHRLSTLSICDRIMVLNGGRMEACAGQIELAETNQYFREAMELARLG